MRLHPNSFVSTCLAAFCAGATLFAQNGADGEAIKKLLSEPSGIGLDAGVAVPALSLKDQTGRLRDRASLSGPNGLVLVFFRSADW